MKQNRRELLLTSGAALMSRAAFGKKESKAPLPSVLLMVAENLSWWMLGCYGAKDIKTPNLDRLARIGNRFYCYSGAPVSEPGFHSLLTGRVDAPSSGGATLGTVFATKGYHCACAGIENVPQGFERASAAVEFLDKQKAESPFLLLVRWKNPLPPSEPLPARYRQLYQTVQFNQSGWLPVAPNAAAGKEYMQHPVENIRQSAAAISELDDRLAPLIAKVNQRGLSDSTLIIFTSSNGYLLGRHGLWSDGRASSPPTMYEEVVRVPMIWSLPTMVPPETTRPEIVSLYDLLPTLAQMTDATIPNAAMPGRSFLPAATGAQFPKKQPWRNLAFSTYQDVTMVRDARYKLTLRAGGKGPNELYNMPIDANENQNRYDDPEYSNVRDRLTGEIQNWRKKYTGAVE